MFRILFFLFLPILTAAIFDYLGVVLRNGPYPPVFPVEKRRNNSHLVFQNLNSLINMLQTCVYMSDENSAVVLKNLDEMSGSWTTLLCHPSVRGKSLDYTISKATDEEIQQFETRCDTKLFTTKEYRLKVIFPRFEKLKPTMIAERNNSLFIIEPNKNICNTINEIEFRKRNDNTAVLLFKDIKHGVQTSPAILLRTEMVKRTMCAFYNNHFRMFCN